MKYLYNKNQENAHFFHLCFNLITVSSTCFQQPSVHPEEELYMSEYQTHPAINQIAYMDACKKYHTTACTSLPEDEHLYVRNMSKTL